LQYRQALIAVEIAISASLNCFEMAIDTMKEYISQNG